MMFRVNFAKNHAFSTSQKSNFSVTGDYGIFLGNYGMCTGFLRVFDLQVLAYFGICLGKVRDSVGILWDFTGRIWDILLFGKKKSKRTM